MNDQPISRIQQRCGLQPTIRYLTHVSGILPSPSSPMTTPNNTPAPDSNSSTSSQPDTSPAAHQSPKTGVFPGEIELDFTSTLEIVSPDKVREIIIHLS